MPALIPTSSTSTRRAFVQGACAAALGAAGLTGVRAQTSEWNARTVHIIVPYAPGSGPDAIARELADQAGPLTGKTFVIENKPGVNGALGSEAVARANGDGATLLVVDPVAIVSNPYIYRSIPFSWQKELRPVAALADVDLFMYCSAKTPFKSVQEVIQFARAHPGKLNFGTAGNASVEHLSVERFKAHAGIYVTRIPYTGMAQVIPALISGEIDIFVFGPLPFLGQIKEGNIRALAAGGNKRSAVLPQIPTLAEIGLPADLFIGTTFTLFAPGRASDGLVNEISQSVSTVINGAKFRDKFAVRGLTAHYERPDSVARSLTALDGRLGPLIKSLKLTAASS